MRALRAPPLRRVKGDDAAQVSFSSRASRALFSELAQQLTAAGTICHRIGFNRGDQAFWRQWIA
jgi:capsule polysaccharide modification protein KpsS